VYGSKFGVFLADFHSYSSNGKQPCKLSGIVDFCVVIAVVHRPLFVSTITQELNQSAMRCLVTARGCVVGEDSALWLRNGSLIDDSFTMSTYDFELLGGAGSGMQDPDGFYIHSGVVLESY
jgi:hypothetical protein